ncbi:hypothetical protein QUC31_003026 [Theobroma cacao]
MDPLLHYLFTLVCSLVGLLSCIYFYQSKKPSTHRKRVCTAPQAGGALPVIGHMHLLGGQQLTHKTLGAMADKYGPVFSIRLGSHSALVLNSWEMARECFTVHDKVFSTRPVLTASKVLGYNYAMFGFAPYGSYWREIRRIATIELLSSHRIDMLKHIRASEVKTAVRELYKSWLSKGGGETGVLVDMKQWFGDLTHNIALRMVGGKRFFGPNADCEEAEARRCQKVMRDSAYLFGVFVVSDALPFIGWLDFQGYEKAMKRTAKELDILLGGWLEEHKQKKHLGGGLKKEQDFMDVMLNILEDAKITSFDADTINKATCLNLVLAGSDTTMITLTWALSLLLNNPRVLKRAQDELDMHVGKDRLLEESDIRNLVYLHAIVKETLRLYPPSPIIFRASMEDCTLSTGYHIPAGTRLMVNAWKIQRDERVWPDPHVFKPERFLTSHKDMEFRGQTFELIPFGSGRRSCPGVSLALQVVHSALASFLQSFEVSKPSKLEDIDMTESTGLTNLKATPLEVLFTPRLDSKLYGPLSEVRNCYPNGYPAEPSVTLPVAITKKLKSKDHLTAINHGNCTGPKSQIIVVQEKTNRFGKIHQRYLKAVQTWKPVLLHIPLFQALNPLMDPFLQHLFTTVCSLVALLSCIYFYQSKKASTHGKRCCTPPQAGGALPVIGHMHLLGGQQLTHKTLGAMADKYGPVFSIRLGSHRVLVLNSWEMAKECFTVHDKVFSTRPSIAASKHLGYDFAMFGFAPYGSYWREMRKIATIELLSSHRIDMLKHIRASEVKTAIRELYKSWLSKGSAETEVFVDMKQWFGDLTHNIALRMVGGRRYFGPNADCEEADARRCQKVMRDFVYLFGVFVLSDAIPFLGWLDFQGYEKSMKRTAKQLDSLVERWLEEHKQKRLSGGGVIEEQDFMDVMLNILEDGKITGFDADTINKATCLNLILAGSDTTMVTLTWALSLLLNNPRVLKRAQDELDMHVGKDRPLEESDISNLVYLQSIVKETLRLYPPSPIIGLRAALEDCTLSTGYHIPSGTRLMVNAWKIQRDERVWPDPHDFQPERFLTSHKDMDFRGQTFELIPFGSGRRSCPGTSLALKMVHFILGRFLHSFDVAKPSKLEDVDMTESAGLTNLKATPLEVLVTPRLNSQLYVV